MSTVEKKKSGIPLREPCFRRRQALGLFEEILVEYLIVREEQEQFVEVERSEYTDFRTARHLCECAPSRRSSVKMRLDTMTGDAYELGSTRPTCNFYNGTVAS